MRDVRMTVAARSDVGRARTNNEDAFTVADLASGAQIDVGTDAAAVDLGDKGALLALSDGMGGHQAGEVASALVLESLRSAMQEPGADGTLEQKIERAVLRAHADVARTAQAENKRGMGATLTAVFVDGTDAYVAEVGDSRAYLLRRGRLRQITRDQSLVQLLVDGGLLSPEDAKLSPQKSVILQAMGLADNVRVAIGRLHLRREDTLLICSDGVSNPISDEELRDVLSADAPAGACARLIDLANERGGDDNLTAIVARFDGEGLAPATPAESVTSTFQVIQDYVEDPSGSASEPPSLAADSIAPPPLAPEPAPAPAPESVTTAEQAETSAAAPTSPAPQAPAPAPVRASGATNIVIGIAIFVALLLGGAYWLMRMSGR